MSNRIIKPTPNLAGFKPDFHAVIKYMSTTGQIIIESGNGIPINPLMLAQVCISVGKANLDSFINAASTMIKPPAPAPAPADRSPDNPPHNFVPCSDNAEICSFCNSHKDNHSAIPKVQ